MITSHRSTSRRPFFGYLCVRRDALPAPGASALHRQVPRPLRPRLGRCRERSGSSVSANSGIVPPDAELPARNWDLTAWDDLTGTERTLFARMQEVFAGFLDHTDEQIGRLVGYLERVGELDNTMIVLLSDNGASQEGGTNGTLNELSHFNGIEVTADEMITDLDDLGGPNLFNNYPKGWAQVGNCPLRFYKQNTHAGGIRDPCRVSRGRRGTRRLPVRYGRSTTT